MKNAKILLSVVLIVAMLFANTAWAAEVFQWIIEPSMTFEFVYDIYGSPSYWGLGSSVEDYDIYNSYGEVVVENAEQFALVCVDGGYGVKNLGNGQYQITDLHGNELCTTNYEIIEILNNDLVKILDTQNWTWGAMDKWGNVVIEPQYNYLADIGYNGWILVFGYKDFIVNSQGHNVFGSEYTSFRYNDNMIAGFSFTPEGDTCILIDKKTGKETLLNGFVDFASDTEIICNGVLMNSKGEMLSEKTELLKNKFEELAMGADSYASTLNSEASYIDEYVYLLEIDRYTDNERKYAVNYKGDVILTDYDYIYSVGSGIYGVCNYDDPEGTYYLIDVDGNIVLGKSNIGFDNIAGSLIVNWDNDLYDQNLTYLGAYDDVRSSDDYVLVKDNEGKVGFGKSINLPDVDISDKIILLVGQRDTYVYGEYRANDVEPLIRNGRTMVPIRAVAEALDANVSWDGDKQMVSITREGIAIDIVIGNSYATVNGESLAIDSPAFIENSRTYLPVRFVSEALGAKVEWDEATQAVILSVAKPQEEPQQAGANYEGTLQLNNLEYWFEEDAEVMSLNPGSVGSMCISAEVTAPSNVNDVLIASWSEEAFSQEEINNTIRDMIEIWKEEGFIVGDSEFPYPFMGAHPVDQEELGKKLYVLIVALDANGEFAGYAVVQEVVNK